MNGADYSKINIDCDGFSLRRELKTQLDLIRIPIPIQCTDFFPNDIPNDRTYEYIRCPVFIQIDS